MVRFEIVVFLTSSSPFKYVFNQVQAFCFVCGEEQHVFEPFHQCSAHFLGQARRLLGDILTRACKKMTHLLQFTDITSLLINAFHFFEDTDHNGEERDSCHVPHFCLDKSHPVVPVGKDHVPWKSQCARVVGYDWNRPAGSSCGLWGPPGAHPSRMTHWTFCLDL